MEKKIKSEQIFSGRILNIRKDTVVLDNGRETTREIVAHNGSVCMIPYNKKNNSFYLVKQYRYAIKDYILEFPAGTIEKDENHKDTALRELREEIYKDAKQITYIGSAFTSPGFLTERMYIYLCEDLSDYNGKRDFDENLEIVQLKQKELQSMIKDNTIKDGKTIMAYLLWEKFYR